MLPTDRPVLGKDLDSIRQALGLLVGDACHLFSISMTKWTHVVRQEAELPIKDSSLALLARFYDRYPELCPIPKAPSPTEMYELINGIQMTDQKAFAALFGAESSAGYRWLKAGGPPSPYAARLMHGFKQMLLSVPTYKRAELIETWTKTVESEGLARGTEKSPVKTGKWNSPGVDKMREAIAKQESEKPRPTSPLKKRGAKPKALIEV